MWEREQPRCGSAFTKLVVFKPIVDAQSVGSPWKPGASKTETRAKEGTGDPKLFLQLYTSCGQLSTHARKVEATEGE